LCELLGSSTCRSFFLTYRLWNINLLALPTVPHTPVSPTPVIMILLLPPPPPTPLLPPPPPPRQIFYLMIEYLWRFKTVSTLRLYYFISTTCLRVKCYMDSMKQESHVIYSPRVHCCVSSNWEQMTFQCCNNETLILLPIQASLLPFTVLHLLLWHHLWFS